MNRLKFVPLSLTAFLLSVMVSAQAQATSLAITDGLAGYWPFDGNVFDVSGGRNMGILNGATPVAGQINNAYAFNGVDNYVEIPITTKAVSISGDVSVQAWINVDPTFIVGPGMIFEKKEGKPDQGYDLRFEDGKIVFTVTADCVAGTRRDYITMNNVPRGEYVHIAATWDRVSAPKIYVNGAEQNLIDAGDSGPSACTADIPFRVGARSDGSWAMDGIIDEFTLWNKILSPEEILWLYNYGNGKSLPIVYWHFEDAAKRGLVTNTATLPNYTADYGTGEIMLVGGQAFTAWNNGSLDGGSFAPNSNTWDGGENAKFWEVRFGTRGQENVKLSSKQRGSNTGPRDFRLRFKINSPPFMWVDVPGGVISVADNFTLGVLSGLPLPVDVNNRSDNVQLSWIMNSNTSVSGAVVGAAGTSRLDDILITGEIITYTVNYVAGENGSITGNALQEVPFEYDGTSVTAVPDVGYHFVDWSDGSTDNPRTDLGVTADLTVTANYAINAYALTYTAGANGSITGTSPQAVNHGDDGTSLTAVPDPGYHFVNWSDGLTDNPRTELAVTGDISVTANFAINIYTLTYTAGANGSITGTSPQTVNHGDDGTAMTAVPDGGYLFVDWSDGSTVNPRTDLAVTGDISATANFVIIPPPVPGGGGGGSAGGRPGGYVSNVPQSLPAEESHEEVSTFHAAADEETSLLDDKVDSYLNLSCLNKKTPDYTFEDTAGHFAEFAVILLAETLSTDTYVTQGYSGEGGTKLFKPEQPVTRAEFLKMAMFANCVDVTEWIGRIPSKTFNDVPLNGDAWYTDHVYSAQAAGIVDGAADGNFYPDRQITRAEATKILVNLQKLISDEHNGSDYFADVDESDWFFNFVSAGKEFGIIYGAKDSEGNDIFKPNDSISRGETALILVRIFNLRDYVTFTDPNARDYKYVAKTAESESLTQSEDDQKTDETSGNDLATSVMGVPLSEAMLPTGLIAAAAGMALLALRMRKKK